MATEPLPDELRRWLRIREGEKAFAKAVPRTPAGLLLNGCALIVLLGYLAGFLGFIAILLAFVIDDDQYRVMAFFGAILVLRLLLPDGPGDQNVLDLGRTFATWVLRKLFEWEENPPEERVWADEDGLVVVRGDERRTVKWSEVKGVRQVQGQQAGARERFAGRAPTDLWALQIPGRDIVLNSDEGGATILRTAQNVVRRRWRPTTPVGATDASLSLSRMSGEPDAERGVSIAVDQDES